MVKLSLVSPITPSVEICGHKFDVLLGEIGIHELLSSCRDKASSLQGSATSDQVLEYLHGVNNSIDQILGQGAFAKLANGRSINAATAMQWLASIAEAALKANLEALKAKHD